MKEDVELVPVTQEFFRRRQWIDKHLPISHSTMALDVLVLAAHYTFAKEPISSKELFHTLAYSEAGVRKHLRRFVAGGWLKIVKDERDSRVRLIVAEQKLLNAMREYANMLLSSSLPPSLSRQ